MGCVQVVCCFKTLASDRPALRLLWPMDTGLTGARLKAADCVWAGLATHYCPAGKLPDT